MIHLVGVLVSIACVAPQFVELPMTNGERDALMICLRVFVILLVFSHAVTYALLRYRPRPGELLTWSVCILTIGVEMMRAG